MASGRVAPPRHCLSLRRQTASSPQSAGMAGCSVLSESALVGMGDSSADVIRAVIDDDVCIPFHEQFEGKHDLPVLALLQLAVHVRPTRRRLRELLARRWRPCHAAHGPRPPASRQVQAPVRRYSRLHAAALAAPVSS